MYVTSCPGWEGGSASCLCCCDAAVNIDVDDVVSVVDPEHGVRRVPVDVVHLPASDRGCPHGAKEDV